MRGEARGAKTRLSAKYAERIRKNLGNSVDTYAVAEAFDNAYQGLPSITTKDARIWAKLHIRQNLEPLNVTLSKLYADSWILGEDYAMQQYARRYGLGKAITATQIANSLGTDWSKWKPGNRAAAALVRPLAVRPNRP